MRYLKRLVGFSIISSISALFAMAEDKPITTAVPADDVIIKMDPYVISGERVLPPPESWRYVLVPALEFTRGNKVVVAPGFQILSNLSEQNTKTFVEEFQLYQFAGTYLWPMIMQSLPREPIVVILDRTKQAMSTAGDAMSLAWDGDPITGSSASAQNNTAYDSMAFNTGTQIVDNATPIVPEFFSNDPTTEAEQPTTNRYQPDGATTTSEAKPFKGRWRQPLPAGFTYVYAKSGVVTAQINADSPRAHSDTPVEEMLAADLSRRLAEYVLFTFNEPPPRWFQSGFGWLIATTSVTPTRITYADTGDMLANVGTMPSLEALVNKSGKLTFEEDLLAAAFTHWGLYGEDRKHAEKFTALIKRQSTGPITPQEFQSFVGLTYKQTEQTLSTYARTFAAFTSHQLSGKIPDMPAFTVREATQAEVARLKADSFISQGKPDLALNELRIAYWRGEREPAMLVTLADLEEKQGSVDRSKRIVQGLLALKNPPILAYSVDAHLHFREATAGKAPDEKLTAKETRTIMGPLGRVIQAGQATEPLCVFFAQVVMRSGGKPHESITGFLEQAAKRFPKNTLIKQAYEFAKSNPPTTSEKPVATTP